MTIMTVASCALHPRARKVVDDDDRRCAEIDRHDRHGRPKMTSRRDKIRKLRALARSPNKHEAALALEKAQAFEAKMLTAKVGRWFV